MLCSGASAAGLGSGDIASDWLHCVAPLGGQMMSPHQANGGSVKFLDVEAVMWEALNTNPWSHRGLFCGLAGRSHKALEGDVKVLDGEADVWEAHAGLVLLRPLPLNVHLHTPTSLSELSDLPSFRIICGTPSLRASITPITPFNVSMAKLQYHPCLCSKSGHLHAA